MTFYRHLGRLAVASAAIVAAVTPIAAEASAFDGYIDNPLSRSFDIFVDSPEWRFFRTPSFCYASENNDQGTLLIGYDRRRDQVHLAFWNKDITSYNLADTTYVGIVLAQIIPGVGLGEVNRDWGMTRFVIAINKDGQRVFNAKLLGADVMRTFSKFDELDLVNGNNDQVQHFHLWHSARALTRLRACLPG